MKNISNLLFPTKKEKNKTSDGIALPKTAQDTIPYTNAYKSGIIETDTGFFTKSYKLIDINFKVSSIEDQRNIFEHYKDFLDSFDSETRIQIVVNNKNADIKAIMNSILCKMEKDGYNEYRGEINEMLRQKMAEGRNNIVSEKYLVVGSHYPNIRDAMSGFSRVDTEISQHFKAIANSPDLQTVPQDLQERLKCLHDILNVGNEENLSSPIDFKSISNEGLTTKDVISPSGFRFENDLFRIGDKYARTLFIKNFPSSLTTDFMADLSSLSFNFTATFNIEPLASDTAVKMVSRQMTNIRANVIKAEKDAFKAGYSGDLISPDLKYAQEQAEILLDNMRSGKQKLFFVNVVIMQFADTKEELNLNTESIITLGNKYLLSINKLLYQQEAGFRTALPLARNDLSVKRLMTTDAVALFIPFTTKELSQKGGMYYGLNAVSKNMIIYNKLSAINQNGLIIGLPGSGKSFAAKREMVNVFLTTKDDIFVIDPESEYVRMAQLLDGAVIPIAPGTNNFLNPFDMDIHYGDSEDGQSNPVTLKSDFIRMLCETAMGKHYELTHTEKSIIDRVVIELYKPYLKHMQKDVKDKTITCDMSASPTMYGFYDLLMNQPEPEAQNIALALEIYCLGSYDTFAHKTTVDVSNRFTVYDIKNIGNGMKELGLQVCLNHIWNKMIENQGKGKRTWLYIDEFHILTKTRSSAEYLQQIWKRARKWAGAVCGITQNIVDLMGSDEAVTILNNTVFIMMLSQSPVDRANLASLYNISDAQLTYITNSPAGQGLIYTGETIIPFIDNFPKDTKLYKVMTSKPEERKLSA